MIDFVLGMIMFLLPLLTVMAPLVLAAAVFAIFSSNFNWKQKIMFGLAGIFFIGIMFIGFHHYVLRNTTDEAMRIIFIVYQVVMFLVALLYCLAASCETEEEEIETEKS